MSQSRSTRMGSGFYLTFEEKDILAVMGLFGESELVQSSEGRRC